MRAEAAMNIRSAQGADLERLCAARNTPALYRRYLAEADGIRAHFLIAEIDGELAGFGMLYLEVAPGGKRKSHLPKLSDLHVVPDYRRRGVGTALVLAREALARRAGFGAIHVSIDPIDSAAMLALAGKLSYQPMQEHAYPVCATFHDSDGNAYEKHYTRLDFCKRLN